jgi:hypothetical protein
MMKIADSSFPFQRTVIALAVCAVFVASAFTRSPPMKGQAAKSLVRSESSMTLGLGGVSGGADSRSIFNQYNIARA